MRRKREEGSSYAAVLIFVASLTVLVGSLTITSGTYARISDNAADGGKALYIANAGLTEGVWWLGARRRSPGLWGLGSKDGDGLYPFPIQKQFGGGTYTVTLTGSQGDGTVDITSEGKYEDAVRKITVTAKSHGYAVFSKSTLSLGREPTTPLEAAANGDLVFVDQNGLWEMKFHLATIRSMCDPVGGRTAAGLNVIDDYATVLGASVQERPVDADGYVEILLGLLENVHWNHIRAKRKGRALILDPDSGSTFHDVVGALDLVKCHRAKKEAYAAYRERVEDFVAELTNDAARRILLATVSAYPYGGEKFPWKAPHHAKPHCHFTVLDMIGRYLDVRRRKGESHSAFAGRVKAIIQNYDYASAARSLKEENEAHWEALDLMGQYENASGETRQQWLSALITQYPFNHYADNQRREHPPNLLDRYGAMLQTPRDWAKREGDGDYQKRLAAALGHSAIIVSGDIHSNQRIWTCDRRDQLNQNADVSLAGRATQVAEGDATVSLDPVDFSLLKDIAEHQEDSERSKHVWTVGDFNRYINSAETVYLRGVHYVYQPGTAKLVYDADHGTPKPTELVIRKVGGSLHIEGCLALDIPGHPDAKVPGLFADDTGYRPLPAARFHCDVHLGPYAGGKDSGKDEDDGKGKGKKGKGKGKKDDDDDDDDDDGDDDDDDDDDDGKGKKKWKGWGWGKCKGKRHGHHYSKYVGNAGPASVGPDADDLPVLASSGVAVEFGPSFHGKPRPAKVLLHFLKRLRFLAASQVPAPNALDRLGGLVRTVRQADESNREYYARVRSAVHDAFDNAHGLVVSILEAAWDEGFEPFASRDELFDSVAEWLGDAKKKHAESLSNYVKRLVKFIGKAPKSRADIRLYLCGQIHCEGLVSIYSRPIVPRVFAPRKHWKSKYMKAYYPYGKVTAFGSIIGGGVYIDRCSMQAKYDFRTYGQAAGLQVYNWRFE